MFNYSGTFFYPLNSIPPGTRHERLVMFLGCGISEDGGCFLVTEFMDGGSLDRVLWGGTTATVSTSWMQRVQILLDVVDGLAYLHLLHKSVHSVRARSVRISIMSLTSTRTSSSKVSDSLVAYVTLNITTRIRKLNSRFALEHRYIKT